MLETKKALEAVGVAVTLDNNPQADLSSFDLVHLFNIDGIHATFWQAKNAVAQNKPYVLSPIHHKMMDIKIWEDTDAYDFKRLIYPIFRSYNQRETLKSLYNALFNPRLLPRFFSQLTVNLGESQKWVVEHAAYLLPNAFGEAEAVKEEITPDFKFRVVPNGVSPAFYKPDTNNFWQQYGQFPFVLCVGRTESRKNQLRVIRAVKALRQDCPDLRLVLVGAFNPHNIEYGWRVRRELTLNPWILHIPELPYDQMPGVFGAALAHVSASWKETTGLVNVEAALAGCAVVAPNKGYCREYLGSEAEYCDPGDVTSIKEALAKCLAHRPSEDFKQSILRDYTWSEAAKKTLEVYNMVLAL